jgi:hypothetical protein
MIQQGSSDTYWCIGLASVEAIIARLESNVPARCTEVVDCAATPGGCASEDRAAPLRASLE